MYSINERTYYVYLQTQINAQLLTAPDKVILLVYIHIIEGNLQKSETL